MTKRRRTIFGLRKSLGFVMDRHHGGLQDCQTLFERTENRQLRGMGHIQVRGSQTMLGGEDWQAESWYHGVSQLLGLVQ